MCGIVGFNTNNIKEPNKVLKNMTDRIIHRGPDAEGFFSDEVMSLGHRRLAILDLQTGNQPLYSKDENYVLVANGEIYNYEELKKQLINDGYEFQTKSDSEILIYGYDKWRNDLPNHLRGMFAFAIYDKKNKNLFAARDHFGIKPFYYYWNNGNFMFASEIKSLLEHPDFVKEVNTDALKMYLMFQYSIKEESLFKNVYKLLPGHYLNYKNGKLTIERYSKLTYDKKPANYEKMKNELRQVIEDSIKYHQITSDVEVGSYLSGGVDSSYVVDVARPNKTFSVGFEYKDFDETSFAKEFSNMLNIKNYSKNISADEFFDILPTIMYHTDEPHANLSTVPLYFLSGIAEEQVKVVLSGEGADEMWAGYAEYNEHPLIRAYLHVPLIVRKGIRNVAKIFPHFPGQNTLKRYGRPFDEHYNGHGTYMEEYEANLMLKENLRTDETTSDLFKDFTKEIEGNDRLTKMLLFDFEYWLPHDILLKADKMSMAHSVELRTPFMDIDVYNYSRKIPNKFLVKNRIVKYIFRDIAQEKLPEEWSKRKKLGFLVPFRRWLRQEKYYNYVKDYFNKDYVKKFFDKEYINQLLDDHYNNKLNTSRKVYNILCFLIWYEVYFVNFKKH